ncbi:hypothetical protein PO909_030607 [Leuciscus waleckii]
MDSADGKKRPASSTIQSSAAKIESDRRRAKTRVNIGAAFDSWRELRSALGIKTDPEQAFFLLQR